MTLKEFYRIARRVKWTVTRDGEIRTKRRLYSKDVDYVYNIWPDRRDISPDRDYLCPLAYVLRSWGTVDTVLPAGAARKIARRADGDLGWRGRYWLKRALGMCK